MGNRSSLYWNANNQLGTIFLSFKDSLKTLGMEKTTLLWGVKNIKSCVLHTLLDNIQFLYYVSAYKSDFYI